ncbi:MAG TPA: alpha/beta hydrolase [Ilumatobacteraceae bacterium]
MSPTEVVLVHGVGLDRHMWRAFAAELDLPSRSYDLIGLGDGPRPPGPYSLTQYSEQLADVVDGQAVDVVGFSMGALVAQRFAADHPKQVRRLVLVSGVYDRSPAERDAILSRVADVRNGSYAASIEPALQRWFSDEFAVRHPDVVDEVRRRLMANDVDAYACAYEVFATSDAELLPAVATIDAPTLIVTGERDERSTPDMARRQAAAMPRATCVIMPGLRHLIPIEAPGELAALVSGFLEADGGTDD